MLWVLECKLDFVDVGCNVMAIVVIIRFSCGRLQCDGHWSENSLLSM